MANYYSKHYGKDIDDAVDETIALRNELGKLSELQTTDTSSIVNAINEIKNNGGGGGGGASLSAEEKAALSDLVAQKYPLTINLSGNGGTYERGSSVTPRATITIKRGTTDVSYQSSISVSSGSISNNIFTDDALTTNKTFTFTATYNSKTATKTLSYAFSNYRYKGEIASLPTTDEQVLYYIQRANKEFNESATLGETTISANNYYLFAVVGTHTFEIRDKATDGIITAAKSGTISVPRVNGTANDTYSYVIVPKSAMAQTIKIV